MRRQTSKILLIAFAVLGVAVGVGSVLKAVRPGMGTGARVMDILFGVVFLYWWTVRSVTYLVATVRTPRSLT